MSEHTRRRLLGGLGAGLAGLLAGCPSADGEGSPAATPTPTPTPTPAVPSEAPAFWGWLPTPAALGTGPYSIGSFDLESLREAELTQRNLRPRRYTPAVLNPVGEATEQLLTLSTADVGTGILLGSYDTASLRDRLEGEGYTQEAASAPYATDGKRVLVEAERLVWADAPASADAVLETVRAQADGDGESYPAAAPALRTVLETLTDFDARFALRTSGPEDDPFADARFLATGIGTDGDTVVWRTAVSFEGTPPTAARDHYQSQFEETQGFENVRTRTSEGLLVMDADTSPVWATSTQPI